MKVICQFITVQSFHVRYLWNKHACLTDFDKLMDHFEFDGSHIKERLCHVWQLNLSTN